jgi:cytochrome c-type biogenesis protein
LKIPTASHATMAKLMERASLPTAFVLGALVGLCEFPCTGGPYLLILGLLHDSSSYWSGLGYLFVYNLVFIIPLALLLLLASDRLLLDKVQNWRKNNVRKFHLWGGLAVIILGVVMLLF